MGASFLLDNRSVYRERSADTTQVVVPGPDWIQQISLKPSDGAVCINRGRDPVKIQFQAHCRYSIITPDTKK